jgi:hypothetical protein
MEERSRYSISSGIGSSLKPELLNPKKVERESMCMSLRSFILTGRAPLITLIE